MKNRLLWPMFSLSILAVASPAQAQALKNVKACFLYLDSAQEIGWTSAHDRARKQLEKSLPWLETRYAEDVTQARAPQIVDKLVKDGCQVIFSTSYDLEDVVYKSAQKYPKTMFMQVNGQRRLPNLGNYAADFYQIYYLNGMAAAAISKTGKLGFVGSVPVPELKRNINAFALGARAVNEKATVEVRWTGEWANEGKAKAATESLIKAGAEVIGFTEDTASVIETAAKAKVPSFAHYSAMYKFAPDYVVSGQIMHWEKIYGDFLNRVKNGSLNASNLQKVSYWNLLSSGAVEMGAQEGMPVNPKWIPVLKAAKMPRGSVSVYERMMALYEEMKAGRGADPFAGPISDRNGKVRISGTTKPSITDLQSMQWAVPGVVGEVPNENK